MKSVAAIKERCEAAGVELVVVAAPVYIDYFQNFQAEDVANFYASLAKVTDFWDFSCSSVSCEPRYFYDATHFRNAVGSMIAARIAATIPSTFRTISALTSQRTRQAPTSPRFCRPRPAGRDGQPRRTGADVAQSCGRVQRRHDDLRGHVPRADRGAA